MKHNFFTINRQALIFILTILTISLLLALSAFAQNEKITPVKVTADTMRYFGSERKISLNGNVAAISEQYSLLAQTVDVFTNEANEITQIQGKGNVNFKSEDISAVADNAQLDQLKKTVIMRGNVRVYKGENYLQGEYVSIQYETQEILIQGASGELYGENGEGRTVSGDERVTVIFNPDSLDGIEVLPGGQR